VDFLIHRFRIAKLRVYRDACESPQYINLWLVICRIV